MTLNDLQAKPTPEQLEWLEELHIERDILHEDLQRNSHKLTEALKDIPSRYYKGTVVTGYYHDKRNPQIKVPAPYLAVFQIEYRHNRLVQREAVKVRSSECWNWIALENIVDITEISSEEYRVFGKEG